MHRNAQGKSVNRTMAVEACVLLTTSTHFESGVVNRIAKPLATSAVLTFPAITHRRSWFAGCQSLLYHRSERATKRSPCTDGRLRTDEHYAEGMRAQCD